MKKIRAAWLPIFFIIGILFSSCKKDALSRLNVYLTDAPSAYDAVNIEVVEIQVKASSDQGESGWIKMPMATSPVIYNLLDFRNGMETLLTSAELPSGNISQLRLILGTKNSIVVNGVTEPVELQVPSGQQTGLKFNINAYLFPGVDYDLWIDFDAARSIIIDGTGAYKLKPVIRTFTDATSGAIKGVVLPSEANAMIEASNAVSTLHGMPDPVTGEFLIRGVPDGKWNVHIKGSNGYLDQTLNNISVSIGQQTNVGTIILTQ